MTLRLFIEIGANGEVAVKELKSTARGIDDVGGAAGRTQTILKGLQAELDREVGSLNRQAKATGTVVDQLKFESDQLKRNSKDREVHNALRAAGVSASSAEGQAIAKLAAGNVDLRDKQERAARGALTHKAALRDLANAAALTGGPLGGMIAQTNMVLQGTNRMGIGLIAGVAVLGLVAAAALKAATAYAQLEMNQARVGNALRLTGGASGQTPKSLEGLTGQLGGAGTQNLTDIRAAQVELLKFRDVSGRVFAEALRQSQDLANTGFTDLARGAQAFGRALTNPVDGLDALREAGLRIDPVQQKFLENLFRSGKQIEFQNALLKITAAQLGGSTADAADTTAAAFGRVGNAAERLFETGGKGVNETTGLKDFFSSITGYINSAADAWERYNRNRAAGQGVIEARNNAVAPLGLPSGLTFLSPAAPVARGIPGPNPYSAGVNQLIAGQGQPLQQDLSGFYPAPARPQVTVSNPLSQAQADAIAKQNIALDRQAQLYGLSEAAQQKFIAREQALISATGGVTEAEKAAGAAIEARVNASLSAQFTRGAVEGIKQQTEAARIEAETFGMSAGSAAAYRAEQEQLARAKASGIALSPQQQAAIRGEAQAFGEATAAVERYRNAKMAADAVSGQFTDALYGWATGAQTASQAILQLSGSIGKMVLQAALAGQGSFAGLFGTQASGGLFGGLLQGLFGGKSPVSGGTGLGFGRLYEKGGFTGAIDRRAIAGVVHGHEFVVNAEATAKHFSLLKAINDNRLPGYSQGGYAGPLSAPPWTEPATSSSFNDRPRAGGNQVTHFHIQTPNPRAFAEDRVTMMRGARRMLARAGRFS
jgi:hypothetical protein